MPKMAANGATAAPMTTQSSSNDTQLSNGTPTTKRDLASWWKNFKRNTRKEEEKCEYCIQGARRWVCERSWTDQTQIASPVTSQGIFGVPLQTSIRYANVAISLYDQEGRTFIYGYVPIVVAKCGVFLKEKGWRNHSFANVVDTDDCFSVQPLMWRVSFG